MLRSILFTGVTYAGYKLNQFWGLAGEKGRLTQSIHQKYAEISKMHVSYKQERQALSFQRLPHADGCEALPEEVTKERLEFKQNELERSAFEKYDRHMDELLELEKSFSIINDRVKDHVITKLYTILKWPLPRTDNLDISLCKGGNEELKMVMQIAPCGWAVDVSDQFVMGYILNDNDRIRKLQRHNRYLIDNVNAIVEAVLKRNGLNLPEYASNRQKMHLDLIGMDEKISLACQEGWLLGGDEEKRKNLFTSIQKMITFYNLVVINRQLMKRELSERFMNKIPLRSGEEPLDEATYQLMCAQLEAYAPAELAVLTALSTHELIVRSQMSHAEAKPLLSF